MKHLHSPNCRHLCAPFWPVPPLIFSYFVRIYQKCHLFNLNLTIFDVGVNFNIFSKVRPFGSAARGVSPLCSPSVRHWFPYPSFQIPSPASLFSTVVPSSLPSASRRRPPPPSERSMVSMCTVADECVANGFTWNVLRMRGRRPRTNRQTDQQTMYHRCMHCMPFHVCLNTMSVCVYAMRVCILACMHVYTYVLMYICT